MLEGKLVYGSFMLARQAAKEACKTQKCAQHVILHHFGAGFVVVNDEEFKYLHKARGFVSYYTCEPDKPPVIPKEPPDRRTAPRLAEWKVEFSRNGVNALFCTEAASREEAAAKIVATLDGCSLEVEPMDAATSAVLRIFKPGPRYAKTEEIPSK